jgi:hypothetical protein
MGAWLARSDTLWQADLKVPSRAGQEGWPRGTRSDLGARPFTLSASEGPLPFASKDAFGALAQAEKYSATHSSVKASDN